MSSAARSMMLVTCFFGSACASSHEARGDAGLVDGHCVAGLVCWGACGFGRTRCAGGRVVCDGDLAPAGRLCRRSAGPCDLPEFCDGRTAWCPADEIAPARTPCSGPFFECASSGVCRDTQGLCETPCELDGDDVDLGHASCYRGEIDCTYRELACVVADRLPAGTPCDEGTCDERARCVEGGP